MSSWSQIEVDNYREFATYPFFQDESFLDGLKDLSDAMNGIELPEETLGQAKAFYFSRRTGKSVDWHRFLQWRTAQASDASSQSSSRNSESLSFQQIADLIAAGQTHLLPYNEKIVEGINPEQPSASTQAVRKKPWE